MLNARAAAVAAVRVVYARRRERQGALARGGLMREVITRSPRHAAASAS